MSTLRWFSGNYLELQIEVEDAEKCSHPGPCDADVREVLAKPYVLAQFDKIARDALVKELHEYGAWSDEELKDDAQNRARMLWIACGDIHENGGEL